LKYTTIRISIEDKERLMRIAKLIKAKRIVDALRYALDAAERELSKCSVDPTIMLKTLKYARDIGETNAEELDKYLYGEEA